jgi:antitoxin (DNA-binding transcriptional repressor) of toxin-antitoxin stability system
MKVLQTAEAKAHFSALIKDVQAGNEVAIAYGKQKETVAVIIPYEQWKKSKKRQLGTLEGKATVHFADEFSISDEELINL